MNAQTVLFGGTFDPIHNAHLEIAHAAMSAFHVGKIMFVPAANPPHKSHGPHAGYEERIHMTELACAGEPAFEVSRIEAGTAKSYSIVTIEKLLAAGAGPLAFLIGADAFADIRSWYRWQDVVADVEFIVVNRPGAQYAIPSGARVFELTGVSLPESSSEIRKRLASGDDRVPVPASVIAYIRSAGLYSHAALK